ncbi:MAG: class I tRNA ligase family protein [Parcubacteria group bacterium]|nr:class I tRNA ligase family protein [Parcubacteria group bacterium]
MDVNFPQSEERILKRWKKENTFEQSLAKRKRKRPFVFYEGPPTANAGPGIHHVLTRVFKDVVCRYKTMQGFFVPRKAGWDTHGLPVELQIEKKLGLKSKKDIERYGIAKFNAACKQSVWEFKKEWEDLTERVGFWLDTKDPYITYTREYIETLWGIIKEFSKRKLLYKDFKVVPYCSRCGTALSSHELAQGYKTITDRSIYVKFKVKSHHGTGGSVYAGDYILAWTTTPWTLPGNIALAIAADKGIQYVRWSENGEHYILAENLASKIFSDFDSSNLKRYQTVFRDDLIGSEYEPLFAIEAFAKDSKAYKVYAADFVSTEDGTGVVHTAVMYGEDDYNLGTKIGLPKFHTVDEQGKFVYVGQELEGMYVKDKKTEDLILEILEKNGNLFRTEDYEHEYPFCWRCSTPLLYYAKESWFVATRKVKAQLLKNNQDINWIPPHIKKGRFGEWLSEVKDWAFSRERYWGTPLPIWECGSCGARKIIGSVGELASQNFSSNTYFLMRHGHSERQLSDVMSCWPEKKPLPLTPKGRAQVEKQAKQLKKQKIDFIFTSDLLRTKQTADIIGKVIGVNPQTVQALREVNVGELNGKHVTKIGKVWARPKETPEEHYLRRFEDPMPGGENWHDVQKRIYNFILELENRYQGKRILLISHELPLSMLEAAMRGLTREEIIAWRRNEGLRVAETRLVRFTRLPLDERMEVNLHRPFVDDAWFFCTTCLPAMLPRRVGKKGTMRRVKDVVDVWFDSGAMPFAQNPKFEIRNSKPPKEFPADYIVEGIDQTRGWFYTLLVVSTLLGFKAPYKNAIVLGHVLDEKGEKMSKSKGNIVNPWEIVNAYGADAVRWYFFTLNQPGDSKLFNKKGIEGSIRKFLLPLWNSLVFYETYGAKNCASEAPKAKNVLDRWILSRLASLIADMETSMDAYDVTGATRALERFVGEDLSQWYIRRSRTRFQIAASGRQRKEASLVLGFVLEQVSRAAASFIPFLSEAMFERLGQKESVHLASWPKPQKTLRDSKLEVQMASLRELVAKILALRAQAGVRVRQPLALLKIRGKSADYSPEILNVLKEEVNIKNVIYSPSMKEDLEFDFTITPELKEEGMVRDIIRRIQEMRKEAHLTPAEKILLAYEGDAADLLRTHEAAVKRGAGVSEMREGRTKTAVAKELVLGDLPDGKAGKKLWIGIRP